MKSFLFHGAHPLPASFFARDTVTVARELLGATLLSRAAGVLTGGRVVEVEAYLGSDDPGSHAATKGITRRNAVMYGPPGHTYVYFTYGNHHMLNLVTEADGVAGAVLVRAIEPTIGVDAMMERRGGRPLRQLASGPGKVAQALGLDLSDNGSALGEGNVALFATASPPGRVLASGRIGLSQGHERVLRFYLAESEYVSRTRTGQLRRARGGQRRVDQSSGTARDSERDGA